MYDPRKANEEFVRRGRNVLAGLWKLIKTYAACQSAILAYLFFNICGLHIWRFFEKYDIYDMENDEVAIILGTLTTMLSLVFVTVLFFVCNLWILALVLAASHLFGYWFSFHLKYLLDT